MSSPHEPSAAPGGSVQDRRDDDPTKTPGVAAGATGQGGLNSAPRLRDMRMFMA